MLGGSKNLFASFLQSAHMSDDGFMALAKAIRDGGGELADEQAKAIEGMVGKRDMGKHVINFSMPGAHIEMKRDFRDQDPDRVAVVFQEDLQALALNRVTSNVTDISFASFTGF